MPGLQVKGEIKLIGKTKEFGENNFKKRAILLEVTEQAGDTEYKNPVFAEFVKDKCSVLDDYKVGQQVTLDINVRCNEHENRWYTNMTAWRISGESATVNAENEAAPAPVGEDDLPF